MPSGMAAEMRAALPTLDRDGLVLKRSPLSKTGFVNVIEVKGKYQARLQVPGDGRGGAKKRKQQALPGLFDTAEDAAVYLASFKQGIVANGWSTGEAAAKIDPLDKKHKPRTPMKAASSSRAAAATASHHHSGNANICAYAMSGICGRIAAPDAVIGLLPTTCLILLYDTYGTYSHMYPVVYVSSMYVTGDNIVL